MDSPNFGCQAATAIAYLARFYWAAGYATFPSGTITATLNEGTGDLLYHCSELRSYVHNNRRAIVRHHRRYHSDRPISTSRAERCVDDIANARIGGHQRMRWFREARIASLSSEQLFLMAGSERLRATRRQPDRPGFFNSPFWYEIDGMVPLPSIASSICCRACNTSRDDRSRTAYGVCSASGSAGFPTQDEPVLEQSS